MRRPLSVLCLLLLVLVQLRMYLAKDAPPFEKADALEISGQVYEKEKDQFYLKSISIQQNSKTNQKQITQNKYLSKKRILVEITGGEGYKLGSFVTLRGTFLPFTSATNPGEFDQKDYYDTLRIAGRVKNAEILKCSDSYSIIREVLYQIRNYFKNRLYAVFPQKEASIMSAMLLGEKQDLDKDVKSLYRENGILHILSISGLHISIIGIGLYRIMRKCGLGIIPAAICGSLLILFYGGLTGMSISAMRAIGMYLLRMLADTCGRTYDIITALALVTTIMVLHRPEYLRHVGFLLSVSSVLGVAVLSSFVLEGNQDRKVRMKYRGKLAKIVCGYAGQFAEGLKQSFLVSLAITLTTLPIQLWFYYEVPVYAILLNLCILPFVGVIVCFGLIAMLLPGSGLLGTIACLVLKGYEFICRLFERLPFHTWNPGRPKSWQVVLYYGIGIALVVYIVIRKEAKYKVYANGEKRRRHYKLSPKVGKFIEMGRLRGNGKPKEMGKYSYIGIISVSIFAMLLLFAIPTNRETSITLLDVGQGDCILVQSKTGQVYLFDCGSSSRKEIGEYVLLPYLKYYGIQQIQGVFVSHADGDHMSGVQELLQIAAEERISIGSLVLPQSRENCMKSGFAELLSLAGEMGIDTQFVSAGDTWQSGDLQFLCLHPSYAFEEEGNAASECFWVQEGAFSMLLTGDIEGVGEEQLLKQLEHYKLPEVTLLKVAHHGSRFSTSAQLLGRLRPKLAGISCGLHNRYGHPHEEVIDRLREMGTIIYRTDEMGAVRYKVSEHAVGVHIYPSF